MRIPHVFGLVGQRSVRAICLVMAGMFPGCEEKLVDSPIVPITVPASLPLGRNTEMVRETGRGILDGVGCG